MSTTTTTMTSTDSTPRNKRMSSRPSSKRNGQSPSVNGSLCKASVPLVGPIDHNLRSPPGMIRGKLCGCNNVRKQMLFLIIG